MQHQNKGQSTYANLKLIFTADSPVSELKLENLAPPDPRNGTTWASLSEHDKSQYKERVKAVLNQLRSPKIAGIVIREKFYPRLEFKSDFEKDLYLNSNSLKKAKLIASIFEKHFHAYGAEQILKLQSFIVKHVNYMGAYMDNFDKIVEAEFQNEKVLMAALNDFSREVSVQFKREFSPEDKKEPSVCITTHNSGFAHRAIAMAVSDQLTTLTMKNKIFNEADEYLETEPLYQAIGMGFGDVYALVKQKGGDEELCNLYKTLAKELALVIEDKRGELFDRAVNGSNVVYVTGMYPHNIRAYSHHGAAVVIQACDYGQIPTSIHTLATQLNKYSLNGIFISIPDVSSYIVDDEKKKVSLEKKQNFQCLPYPVAKHWYVPVDSRDLEQVRHECKLGTLKEKLLVMMVGGEGVSGILENYLHRILKEATEELSRKLKSGETPEKLNIAAICGKNETMRSNLINIFSEYCVAFQKLSGGRDLNDFINLQALGFTENRVVSCLVRSSDAYLTKPGGSCTAESLSAVGIPERMLIHLALDHKNEFENAEVLQKYGATILDTSTPIYSRVMNSKFSPILRPPLPDNTVSGLIARLFSAKTAQTELTLVTQDTLKL